MIKTKQFVNPGSLILLFLLIWMISGNIRLKQEMAILDERNVSLIQDSTSFVKKVNSLGDSVLEQKQLVTSERMARNLLFAELDDFKKVASQVKTVTKVEIREVRVPVPMDAEVVEIDSAQYMKLPAVFSYHKPKLQFNIEINRSGLMLDSLIIPNTTTVTIGSKKRGFLRKPDPVVEIKHSSPYVQTYGMNNVVIDNPTPWYNTRAFNIGVGFVIGTALAK